MESLVVWNLSKALERNPALDFQEAIAKLQWTMERSSRELNAAVFARPQERHVACALLAWQQLRRSAHSLVRFAESKRDELLNKNDDVKSEATLPESTDEIDTASILQKQSFLMGPVVALPLHTKVIMRVEKTSSSNKSSKSASAPPSVIKKLEAAGGCVELGCVAKLKELDRGTSELRARASKLSRREAERAELLERAEMAWRELEVGFQRRLRIADEKEEQYATRIATLIEERKEHKQTCVDLIAKVKEKADSLEKRKATMQKCEEEVCGLACLCHQLNEEVIAVDSALAEASTKFHQLDRECQLKEEQAQRRMNTLNSQLEAAQQFTLEAELALRGELGALQHQIETVSAELLKKDEKNEKLNDEIEQLKTVKLTLVEDLEECNRACDLSLQGRVAALKAKTAELAFARDNALKCSCQVPTEAAVQARRSPSLAALCCCPPGKRDEESCSCTSLRSKLLNDLLVELFSGLRAELGDTLNLLPCQMLKCLEDSHNWEHATTLKNSLQSFFSKLLVGELDIAIATSIENYHAKWVGGTCVDGSNSQAVGGKLGTLVQPPPPAHAKPASDCGCWANNNMKDRIEELASQMIDKRIKEFRLDGTSLQETSVESNNKQSLNSSNRHSYDSNNKVSRGSRGSDERDPSVLYCHVPHPRKSSKEVDILPAFLKRTHNDVTQLRAQIEDLKKETIKKTDLKSMEENIVKLLQNATRSESPTNIANNLTKEETTCPRYKSSKNVSLESTIKVHNYRNVTVENSPRNINFIDINKNMLNYKKRPIKDFCPPKKYSKLSVYGSGQINKSEQKVFKKYTPAYAVNVCLCPDKKELPSTGVFRQGSVVQNMNIADKQPLWARTLPQHMKCNQETLKDDLETALQFEMDIVKESELLSTNKQIPRHENSLENFNALTPGSLTDCVGINKMPSTSSVERLLKVLSKWKMDLNTSAEISTNKNSELLCNKTMILKNSDSQLNANLISMQSLKRNSLHSSYKSTSHGTKFGVQNSNKSSTQSTHKANVQNLHRNNVQLLNKAVNSPTKVYSNVVDIEKIPEIAESDKHSQKTRCKNVDLLADSNKELILLISNSQNSLGKETDFNKVDPETNPLASESKYMGQIHFNKPGQGTCTCVDNNERSACKCVDSYEDKTKLQYQNPSRGTEAHASDFKDSLEQIKVKSNIISSDGNKIPCFDAISSKEIHDPDSYYSPLPIVNVTKTETIDDNFYVGDNKSNKSKSNLEDLLNKSEGLLSNNYDYNVKFLGVTLNDANVGLESESSLLSNIGYVEKNKINQFVRNKPSFLSRHKSKLYTSCKKSNDQMTSCRCHDKFEDLKQYFNDLLTNCKSLAANEDKSLDVQSFNDSITEEDLCVCCDETNDLEMNTFELIKDHLKSKLQELKFSSCQFTCVPREDEEKLLTAILVKVKQVISDSTKHTCKCSDVSKMQDSWNRAYALLQEYLKTKIKRVQCVCSSPSSADVNPLVPDVLEKVCHLIENDFDRLKNICHTNDLHKNRFEIPVKEKSMKDSNKNVMVHRVDVISTVLPDFNKTNKLSKDVSQQSVFQNHKQISTQSFLKNHKQISEQSFLKTENISSQVSKNFGENKLYEIGSSCLKFDEVLDNKVKHDKNDLEEHDQIPAEIKLKEERLEMKKGSLECPKLSSCKSLIGSEDTINKKGVLEVKSERKIPFHNFPELKPNLGECACAAAIWYHLDAQKRGETIRDIKKIPFLSTQNRLNFTDYEYDVHASVNTSYSDEITLKHKDVPNINQTQDACATNTIEKSCDHYHRCLAGLASRLYQIDNDPHFHPLEYPIFEEKVQNAKSEMYPNLENPNNSNSTCDCSLIPLCHVKMLVENIEDKLANCRCTCDSFSSNVCPVHSKLYQ